MVRLDRADRGRTGPAGDRSRGVPTHPPAESTGSGCRIRSAWNAIDDFETAPATTVIGPHYGEWWNERPARSRTRWAILLVPLALVSAWGIQAGLSGPRLDTELLEATRGGDAGAVRNFLARGGSASTQHADGTTLLHWAQEYGHRDLAMLLMDEGADVNAADREEVTSLHRAAGMDDADMVSRLLRKGADPGAMSRRHGAPLHWAARAGSAGATRALLDAGAPVDPPDDLLRTPLHVAVLHAHRDVAELLRARGADPDARLPRDRTLLHWAAATRRRDMAARIVFLGAEVGATDAKGNTALHYAALRGDTGLAAFLIEHGASVNVPTPELLVTPLHYAAGEGHLDTARLLLVHGADPDARSRFYGTPLHWAADRGQREAVGLLIAHGALAAVLDDHRLTSLERARRRGHTGTAAFLATVTPAVHRREIGPEASGSPEGDGPGARLPEADRLRERAVSAPAENVGCVLPRHMHRASRAFLDDYLAGDLPVAEFRRLFSLPNSDYLGLGSCLVALYE